VSLEKILALAGATGMAEGDPTAGMALSAALAARELSVLLASGDDDEDGPRKSGSKDDGDDDDGGSGGDHASHATYKAMVKRNIPPKRAAAMCAKSDKNVKATQLARALEVILSGLFDEAELASGQLSGVGDLVVLAVPASETAAGRKKAASSGHALGDGSYPIEDKKHLHSAAVLAASGHGKAGAAKELIRKRARELGVDVKSLPGFGGSDEDNEKAAASMVALAKAAGGGVAMHHAPMTGAHSHAHAVGATHEHDHQHFGDNNHSGGPLHRPGSEPRRDW
jgi:hypothetical protein